VSPPGACSVISIAFSPAFRPQAWRPALLFYGADASHQGERSAGEAMSVASTWCTAEASTWRQAEAIGMPSAAVARSSAARRQW
jgi:hypothetical protein